MVGMVGEMAVSRYKVDSRSPLRYPMESWKTKVEDYWILLKRKGDKSIQEYETDAGIQKWTEQRLTKSSAQVSSLVKMYHNTILPFAYQAVISDVIRMGKNKVCFLSGEGFFFSFFLVYTMFWLT
ncbi:uncharacterized protein LOC141880588 isoform X2 [Acropora palmata]|uniref:uncharacterized protein LOC141880588 isoform X2 n=2 Tax=Acropora palmata TaxID=6131 RepID=UPI003DA1AA12